MKKLLLYCCVASIVFYSCAGDDGTNNKIPAGASKIESDTASYTTIRWIDSLKNFGTAKYGDKVTVQYSFKNTGNKPLYLLSVRPTCGCTIADYTQSAVTPGGQGFVKAVYDSKHGVPGNVRKSIIVTSNTKNDTHFVLSFTGEVTK